ncbi:MAG: hypothetical protein MUE52_16750 [Tabrizicola sp.]|jgi:hypothetical protein|nr:hypothetical protein [Tabrizicola sp.]
MDRDIEAAFLKTDARDLPAVYVQQWYNAAYDDTISHLHIAWFLPRVMELLVAGEQVALVGHEVVFQRMRASGYPAQWADLEVAAVQGFAEAFFAALLADEIPRADPDIDSWLCMFGTGGVEIAPLLRAMDAMPDTALAEKLNQTWCYNGWGDISLDSFWNDSPAKRQAWDWYTSETLLQRMESTAMAGSEKALEVHSVIARVRAREGL